MFDDDVGKKIEQAEFHLLRLRASENQLAIESHFAGFIAVARSAVMYIHERQVANGRAAKSDWTLINDWEKKLCSEDRDSWRAVVDLRNSDTHHTPALPVETWQGGYFGGYFGGYMGSMFGASPALTVAHPETGNRTKVLDLAERSLRVVKRLALEYRGL